MLLICACMHNRGVKTGLRSLRWSSCRYLLCRLLVCRVCLRNVGLLRGNLGSLW